jgi:hypothetical protein
VTLEHHKSASTSEILCCYSIDPEAIDLQSTHVCLQHHWSISLRQPQYCRLHVPWLQTRGWTIFESRDILLQPLLPVILGEAAQDATFNHALKRGQYHAYERANVGQPHIE